MILDFRNINTLWSSLLVETLYRLGLTTAIICPGSRSAPLAVAFAQHPNIETIPILDERSAAFFALGRAKKTKIPVVLVCTSGTAGANFYPAVIEAHESRIPLLILTADRPPELRHCHAGQAIDQIKLYGHYPNWQAELAIPSQEIGILRYLRQTLVQSWRRSLFPTPGVVHLNCPFREPLAPIFDPNITSIFADFDLDNFLSQIDNNYLNFSGSSSSVLPSQWLSTRRGIIIAGVAYPVDPKGYCQAIANLAQLLNFPVLADALSPVRNFSYLNPYLICTYDLILRHPQLNQSLIPDVVIQIGEFPTSKELRVWLESLEPDHWIIDPTLDNLDPLHNKTIHLTTSIDTLTLPPITQDLDRSFLKTWLEFENKVRHNLEQKMSAIEYLLEAKIAWLLPQILPKNSLIFVSNSMPVRDMDFFWMPNHLQIIPYCNRGANGIDGTLSTALGMAYKSSHNVMLTGDLSLLHDTNGFLINKNFKGHLTIILINNNGGGIFEILPISQFRSSFEDFFATPQNIDFSQLCQTYNISHQLIDNWSQFTELLNPLPSTGIRVLEVQTNRQKDALWLKDNLVEFANFAGLTQKRVF
ncbi:2-succinyl-5-enolpyruvyl-6-hydroxy-3-cyclohexene-1-carboxylic-acid synthase [Aphanothece sacrum]|uniref:2-succinyl-5-enolpyruvyl-6-hydroxy-3-cyclohexene-1-carboxylate synthase n=1 Tax=Aphanothece sacrum FPU1 TaxID=1920663 RepID=A0A401INX0_APHSA|nr:2-succinyl-5-enolpyruvyl-6-hydroxy-3-cyclohexene-1-carboxylic-acid synthase [Aphanothece sacrum]GBF82916.1 2-succinyl-5-enolpyruvyl-6-hydroxy-3-cyclohexene-1-carboxylate synthase [Aphanothece sacrum FPU1]GBF86935.1 2-succinyl-5-enolpyruvyl-6-hydroxy-3-cyclohexene-1-carboxylate synthase [Aphanothece sacrum FPU3]